MSRIDRLFRLKTAPPGVVYVCDGCRGHHTAVLRNDWLQLTCCHDCYAEWFNLSPLRHYRKETL
jgi:hypothetical protein